MPWAEDPEHEEDLSHDVTPGEPESDDDDHFGRRYSAECIGIC